MRYAWDICMHVWGYVARSHLAALLSRLAMPHARLTRGTAVPHGQAMDQCNTVPFVHDTGLSQQTVPYLHIAPNNRVTISWHTYIFIFFFQSMYITVKMLKLKYIFISFLIQTESESARLQLNSGAMAWGHDPRSSTTFKKRLCIRPITHLHRCFQTCM